MVRQVQLCGGLSILWHCFSLGLDISFFVQMPLHFNYVVHKQYIARFYFLYYLLFLKWLLICLDSLLLGYFVIYFFSSPSVFLCVCVCVCVCVLVTQPCLTLCNPMDCSPPGSLSRGFSRQEYLSRLPLPSLGDLPNPGICFLTFFTINFPHSTFFSLACSL